MTSFLIRNTWFIALLVSLLVAFWALETRLDRLETKVDTFTSAPLHIGDQSIPECSLETTALVHNMMNAMGVYHWVVTCEEIVKMQEITP